MRQLTRPPMRLPGTEPAVATVAGVCLLLALLLGLTPVLTALTAHEGMTLVPSALGAPFALPSLRAVPLGSTGWPQLLCEDFAAAILVAVAALRMRRHLRRRPEATRLRRLLAGWTALIAGAATAGVWRGLVTARMVDAGPVGWLTYGVAGAVFGALWGVALGWLTALAALAGPTRPAPNRSRSSPRPQQRRSWPASASSARHGGPPGP
ncbi:hypothetical protein ACIBCO_03840 [Streptomyces violascens]|uniref:hypothetical protein n=1 Tax=Streptomyces violascens TaxID=67381 RepID=UPI0037ADA57C